MGNAYMREESLRFLIEYLLQYTPTRWRAWDAEEEPTVNDKEVEGVKKDRLMEPHFLKLIHGFVLDNSDHMEPYRRRFDEAVEHRSTKRSNFQKQHCWRGGWHHFVYPPELQTLPKFEEWVLDEV